MAEIGFNQYAHLGVLDMSAGNVCGQVELAIRVYSEYISEYISEYFRIRPCLGCAVGGKVPLAENNFIKPLDRFPAQESV